MFVGFLVTACVLMLCTSCATSAVSDAYSRRFSDLLARFPGSDEPLQIRKLTNASVAAVTRPGRSPDVFVIVHPAYSLFFREAKSLYTKAKFRLLLHQFNDEARFIREAAVSDRIVVLIIPGDFETESIASSYISYLNSTASAGRSVFYLVSESTSSGTVSMNEMVDLYHFLDGIKAGKLLIGGGFIGRCQRQFYNQAAAYLNRTKTFIVPEISVISPDDVSESEAVSILESIERRDFAAVKEIISREHDEAMISSLSLPALIGTDSGSGSENADRGDQF